MKNVFFIMMMVFFAGCSPSGSPNSAPDSGQANPALRKSSPPETGRTPMDVFRIVYDYGHHPPTGTLAYKITWQRGSSDSNVTTPGTYRAEGVMDSCESENWDGQISEQLLVNQLETELLSLVRSVINNGEAGGSSESSDATVAAYGADGSLIANLDLDAMKKAGGKGADAAGNLVQYFSESTASNRSSLLKKSADQNKKCANRNKMIYQSCDADGSERYVQWELIIDNFSSFTLRKLVFRKSGSALGDCSEMPESITDYSKGLKLVRQKTDVLTDIREAYREIIFESTEANPAYFRFDVLFSRGMAFMLKTPSVESGTHAPAPKALSSYKEVMFDDPIILLQKF